jgi:2-oxoglutarate dehydrogenase E1 component
MPATASPVEAFTHGGFQPVLDDPNPPSPDSGVGVRRLVFTTGKFAWEAMVRRDETSAPVAIIRLEQLYPWPRAEIQAILDRHPDAEVFWAQEEPGNMGARYFARRRIEEMANGRIVDVIARTESASPASGSSTVHDTEQKALLDAVVANL